MVVPTMLVGIHIEKFMVCKGYESKDLGFRTPSKEFTLKPMPYAKSLAKVVWSGPKLFPPPPPKKML